MPNRNTKDSLCLTECPFKSEKFNFLKEEEIEILQSSCNVMNFEKKENVCKQSLSLTNAIFLSNGIVKIQDETQKTLLNILNQGYFLGVQTYFSRNNCNFTISALTECRICLIKIEEFERILEKNSQLCLNIVNQLSRQLVGLYEIISNVKHKSIVTRLSYILLTIAEKFYKTDDEFKLDLSRQDLADLIGSSRENTVRALTQLKQKKVIDLSGKNIKILDKIELYRISRM